MNDNIESWSRTRRASAHSITMSSDTGSEASSMGPSSFTDNLTMYLNGERDYRPAMLAVDQTGLDDGGSRQSTIISSDSRAVNEIIEPTGHLAKSLLEKNSLDNGARHDNNGTSHEAAGNSSPKSKDYEILASSSIDGELWVARTEHDRVTEENHKLRLELEQYKSESSAKDGLEAKSVTASPQIEEADARTEALRQQAEVHMLRVQELESKLVENIASLKALRDQEAESGRKVHDLEARLELQEAEAKKELDDQSLIEELEDDLERTRHELDRMIKDKRRCERQLDFSQSDLAVERARNEELEGQIRRARDTATTVENPNPDNRQLSSSNVQGDEERRQLKEALEQTNLRLKKIESKLLESTVRVNGMHLEGDDDNEIWNIAETNERSLPNSGALTRAMEQISMLEIREAELKSVLLATQKDTNRLRSKLRESDSLNHEQTLDIERLREEVAALEDVKARMGRVLMYQWGKEEVGEIARSRKDGTNERGMGYKYKYFNKNGDVKDESKA